jgi:hypothetical protein
MGAADESLQAANRGLHEGRWYLHLGRTPGPVPRQRLDVYVIDVLAAFAVCVNNSSLAQVTEDGMSCSFGDSGGLRYLAHARVRVARDLNQNVRMVREEAPGPQYRAP